MLKLSSTEPCEGAVRSEGSKAERIECLKWRCGSGHIIESVQGGSLVSILGGGKGAGDAGESNKESGNLHGIYFLDYLSKVYVLLM
mmetsp:Transcript_3382/g.8613  ORF Transcript_3382/g.8613 Transcript_3382/m.8613 type:complete len:86 (+) Transcript_3382:869-1126(+)